MPRFFHFLFLLYKFAEIVIIITIIVTTFTVVIACLFLLFIYLTKNLQHFSLIRLYAPNHTSRTFFQLLIEKLNQIVLIIFLNARCVALLLVFLDSLFSLFLTFFAFLQPTTPTPCFAYDLDAILSYSNMINPFLNMLY